MTSQAAWRIALAVEALAAAEAEIDVFLAAGEVDAHAVFVTRLVVEEVVRNLIQHTPPYESHELTDVRVVVDREAVTVVVEDNRQPFAPGDAPPLDVGAPLEARRTGGMGLHLLRSLTDTLTYEHLGDRNRLTAIIRRA